MTDVLFTMPSSNTIPPPPPPPAPTPGESNNNNPPGPQQSSKLPTLRKGRNHGGRRTPPDPHNGSASKDLLSLGLPRLIDIGTSPQPDRLFAIRKQQNSPRVKQSAIAVVQSSNSAAGVLRHSEPSADLVPYLPHEQREMNPEPVPFHPRMFNWYPTLPPIKATHKRSPLTKVTVIGQSLPSLHGKESPGANSLVSETSSPTPTTSRPKDRSSTIIKKFSVPRRHDASWGNEPMRHTRGVILHSERYQWDEMANTPDRFDDEIEAPTVLAELHTGPRASAASDESQQGGVQFMVGSYTDPALMVQLRGRGLMDQQNNVSPSQRERIQTEMEFLERMRGIKRRGQMVQHREPQHLLLGGKQVAMCERMDIMGEISRLRTMSHVLPTKAKDLYVGRGFKLPPNHKLNKGIPGKTVILEAVRMNRSYTSMPEEPIMRSKTLFAIKKPKPLTNIKSNQALPVKRSHTMIGHYSRSKQNPVVTRSNPESPSLAEKDEPPAEETKPTTEWSKVQSSPGPYLHDIGTTVMEEDEEVMSQRPESEMSVPQPRAASEVPGARAEQGSRLETPGSLAGKAITPNPLKGQSFLTQLDDEETDKLKQTFKRLDTDADGHVTFNQVKGQLPSDITPHQEKYIKQVYDITSASTFFGEHEYISLSLLCERITKTDGEVKGAFEKLDSSTLKESIITYVELFQAVDRSQTGQLSQAALRQILSTALEQEVESDTISNIVQTLKLTTEEDVDKLTYLVHVPYFLLHESQQSTQTQQTTETQEAKN